MCGFARKTDTRPTTGPAGIYGSAALDKAAAEALLFAPTSNSFTDEGYADMEEYTGVPVEEPATAHFDLTARELSTISGALAIAGELLEDGRKLKLALSLGLINESALTVFISPGDDLRDDTLVPWPPTASDIGRTLTTAGDLGLRFTGAIAGVA